MEIKGYKNTLRIKMMGSFKGRGKKYIQLVKAFFQTLLFTAQYFMYTHNMYTADITCE